MAYSYRGGGSLREALTAEANFHDADLFWHNA